MVAESDACRKELVVARKKVVARNCWSQGIGGRKEGIVVARKELWSQGTNWWSQGTNWWSQGTNWWSQGIGSRKELVVARNW